MYENLALSDNGFLFDTRTGNTYSLNRTGTWILRALIAHTPVDELPGKMAAAFDVDDVSAKRDLDQFLFRLKDMQLVTERMEAAR